MVQIPSGKECDQEGGGPGGEDRDHPLQRGGEEP